MYLYLKNRQAKLGNSYNSRRKTRARIRQRIYITNKIWYSPLMLEQNLKSCDSSCRYLCVIEPPLQVSLSTCTEYFVASASIE